MGLHMGFRVEGAGQGLWLLLLLSIEALQTGLGAAVRRRLRGALQTGWLLLLLLVAPRCILQLCCCCILSDINELIVRVCSCC